MATVKAKPIGTLGNGVVVNTTPKDVPITLKQIIDTPGSLPIAVRILGEPTDRHLFPYGFPETCLLIRVMKIPHVPDQSLVYLYISSPPNVTSYYLYNDLSFLPLDTATSEKLTKECDDYTNKNIGRVAHRFQCTLGTDPEIFAVNDAGEVVPAWTFLKDKEHASHYNQEEYRGSLYWDGFQAEFSTTSFTCLAFETDCVRHGLQAVHKAAKKVGAKLTIKNVLPISSEALASAAEEHVQFGCARSYNIYGLTGCLADGRTVPYRFAGGHIHLGNPDIITDETVRGYISALDKILGVASVSLLGFMDDNIRRKFYGLPGEYRRPKWGLEYRVLSNAWLCHPVAMHLVFELARAACGLEYFGMMKHWRCDEKEAIEIITNNDINMARKVLERNLDTFKQLLYMTNIFKDSIDTLAKVWLSGIDLAVRDVTDLVENWRLDTDWTNHSNSRYKNWGLAWQQVAAGLKV